jgi:YD repeat-containing protein
VGYASDGFQSVLIASNELLSCGHYGGELNQTVTFHDTNGVPWVAIVTNTIHPVADLVIAQLSNAAPASIVIPYVLPPDYTNYIPGHTLLGMPAFWLHKNPGHIDYAPIADIGDCGWYGYGTWVELNHANSGFSGSSATGGDSGSPAFLSWSNCPVLMFATTLAGDARGLFVSGMTNWNSLAALGLTNGLKVLDVSGYPTLTGNGRYTVTVTVSGAGGTNADLPTNHVSVFSRSIAAPVAGFTGTPTSGLAPLRVVFRDASIGSISNWLWNFGDGNSITNSNNGNVTNTYAIAGNYTVTLILSGPGGTGTDTQTNYVSVSTLPAAPVAGFTGTPVSGLAPLQTVFSDASSGSITNWFWNFGDGNSITNSNNGNVTNTYAIAGNYTVTLILSGPGGTNTDTQTNYVNVSTVPAAPVAGFTGTPTNGPAPLQVVFSDASSSSITNWLWNFGDGNSITNSNNGNVTNIYAASGNYTVTLTVSGAEGTNTDTQNNYVSVAPMPAAPGTGFTTLTGNRAPVQGMSSDASSVTITLNTPASQLTVSADSVFTFTWQTTDSNPSATVNLYLDANNNPASGLIPIVSGLQNGSGTSYVWQASSALAGTNYYAYATITDGTASGSSFAPSELYVDSVGAFRLLSSIVATNASYVCQYVYDGTTYTGTNQLVLGANVVSVTNGTAVHQFIVTRLPSLTQMEAVQYNPLNLVSTITNGNGIVSTLTYDPLGRVVQRQSSNGALVTYGYDVLGNRTNMTDYTGTTFYQYDGLRRLTNIVTSKSGVLGSSDNLSLSYEYDLSGRKTAIVYPGGERIQYGYDNAGRLLTVNNVTRTLLFQYTYNPITGQLTKLTRPNGIETDYAYDGMGRLTNILHKVISSGLLVAQYGYTLDAIGKAMLLTTTLPSGTKLEQYSYDYFDRLTNVIYGDSGVINNTAPSVGYSYDGNGNRLTMTTCTNNTVTEIRYYNYGAENRLLNVTNQNGVLLDAYSYDPAGNRIQKVTTNYTAFYSYDERNLMTSYLDATNQTLYSYNGDAQRVSQTVNGVLTTFVLDPMRASYEVVQERNVSSTITASYMFDAARLTTWNNGAVAFPLTDRVGSVRIVTDINGNIVQSNSYDVFGNAR